MPKVLISDSLSPAAVEIFKNRGVERLFDINLIFQYKLYDFYIILNNSVE